MIAYPDGEIRAVTHYGIEAARHRRGAIAVGRRTLGGVAPAAVNVPA